MNQESTFHEVMLVGVAVFPLMVVLGSLFWIYGWPSVSAWIRERFGPHDVRPRCAHGVDKLRGPKCVKCREEDEAFFASATPKIDEMKRNPLGFMTVIDESGDVPWEKLVGQQRFSYEHARFDRLQGVMKNLTPMVGFDYALTNEGLRRTSWRFKQGQRIRRVEQSEDGVTWHLVEEEREHWHTRGRRFMVCSTCRRDSFETTLYSPAPNSALMCYPLCPGGVCATCKDCEMLGYRCSSCSRFGCKECS